MSRTLEDLGVEIERRWAQLGTPSADSTMRVLDLPQSVVAGQLLLGVSSDGSRLLIPIASDTHRSFKPDRHSRGVQLLLAQLDQDDVKRWYLDVVCLRSELRWLFTSFVADVLIRFEKHPELEPSSIVRECYSAWRALFIGAGARMTLKQLAGLFGELHVLGRLLDHSREAIGRWRGPFEEPHDFVGSGLDLEIKTTLSDEDEIVHIHGLEQLSAREGTDLCLVHVRTQTPADDGESVDQLIERLQDLDASGRLASLVSAAGYRGEERHVYAEVTFRVVEERWYRVDTGFPRLSAGTFPGGVIPIGLADFSYSLDLSAVSLRALPAEEIEASLERAAR